MMTNSVVPIAKELKARTTRAKGILQILSELFQKGSNGFFVALVENPLADAPGVDETGAAQCPQMCGDG
jgi:hypothetical protein